MPVPLVLFNVNNARRIGWSEMDYHPESAYVAGRPQPTLCKHGGEAEPATYADRGIASAQAPRSDSTLQ